MAVSSFEDRKDHNAHQAGCRRGYNHANQKRTPLAKTGFEVVLDRSGRRHAQSDTRAQDQRKSPTLWRWLVLSGNYHFNTYFNGKGD
jgi:hypothetical protein